MKGEYIFEKFWQRELSPRDGEEIEQGIKDGLQSILNTCEFICEFPGSRLIPIEDGTVVRDGHRGPMIVYPDGEYHWWYHIDGGYRLKIDQEQYRPGEVPNPNLKEETPWSYPETGPVKAYRVSDNMLQIVTRDDTIPGESAKISVKVFPPDPNYNNSEYQYTATFDDNVLNTPSKEEWYSLWQSVWYKLCKKRPNWFIRLWRRFWSHPFWTWDGE